MSDRRDYLPVCNDHGIPLPDFQATFCVRCMQPECSRSKAGGLFESRVATWQDRLFINPPRMPRDDPQYSIIAAKMFKEIDVGRRVPEIGRGLGGSAWVDPLVVEPTNEPKPTPRAAVAAPVTAAPATGPVTEGPAPAAHVGPRSKPFLNTPFVQGTMVGAAAAPRPTVDPWAGAGAQEATVSTPSGKVVSPGAKIRFRRGGG